MAKFISADGKEIYDGSRKRTIILDDVEYKRVPKPKYKSRATRCAESSGAIEDISCQVETMIGELEGLSAENGIDQIKDLSSSISETLQGIDLSELESLRDEIEQWKSGMEGTGLESTEKYQTLEECYGYLDEAISTIESIDTLEAIEPTQSLEETDEKIDSFISDAQQIVSELQEAVGTLESCEFPGMYS
jgi:t-SNARE complex subunit (syntaxin)